MDKIFDAVIDQINRDADTQDKLTRALQGKATPEETEEILKELEKFSKK